MKLRETYTGKLQVIDVEINEEGKDKKEALRVSGLFAVAGLLNQNNRVYPQDVLEKATDRFNKEIDDTGPVFSLDGHPKDGESIKIGDVSHSVYYIYQDEDTPTDFYAFLQVLPTEKGKNLWAIVKSGGSVGLSMRGVGEVVSKMQEGKNVEVVQNFVLQGIDAVLTPSFPGARFSEKNIVGESLTTDVRMSEFQEAKNWEKWVSAKGAGFKGTFEEYKEKVLGTYKLNEREQKLYTYAKIAGFKGSPVEYKKRVILGMKEEKK